MLVRRLILTLALAISCGSYSASAQPANAPFPSPSNVPLPGRMPANDPFPPRTQLRAPTIAANDNMLRGLGRSAGALNDELRLVMSADEANARTARFVRGTAAAIRGSGGSTGQTTWLGRSGRLAKLYKPLGYLLTAFTIGALAFDLYSYGDSDTNVGLVSGNAYVDSVDPAYSGQRIWSSVFIPGAFYKKLPNVTILQPSVDYPLGEIFITPVDCFNSCLSQGFIYILVLPMPSTYTGPSVPFSNYTGADVTPQGANDYRAVFKAPDGNWYEYRHRQYSTYFGGTGPSSEGRARWVEDPLNPGWWRYDPPSNPARPQPDVVVPATNPARPGALPPSNPVPPSQADAPVNPSVMAPFIDEGLRSAGLDAPVSMRDALASTAAAGVKAGDLNAIPSSDALTNPAASPLNSFVPDQTADMIAEPSTPSNPNPGTNPNPAPSPEPFPGMELQVEEPGDMPGIPNVTIPYVEIGPVACPRYNLGATTEDPRANEILRIAGVRSDDPTDMICQPLEENAIWLRPLIFALWTMLALGVFKGNA